MSNDGCRCPHIGPRCHKILILLPECNCVSTSQSNSLGASDGAAWDGGLAFPSNQNAHAADHDVLGSCHDQPSIMTANAISPPQLSSQCINPQYLSIPGPPYGGYSLGSGTYGDFDDPSPAVESTQAVSNEERPVGETSYFGLINLALSATDDGGDPNVNNMVEGYFNMVIDSPFFGYPGDANPQLDNNHDFNYPQVDDEELGNIQEEHWYSQESEYSQEPQYSEEPDYGEEPEHDQNAEHNQQAPEDKGEAPQPAGTAAATIRYSTRRRLLAATRHAAGRCVYCGKVNPDPVFKGCPDCMARRREFARAGWKRRREARLWEKLAERETGGVSPGLNATGQKVPDSKC